MSTLNTSFIYKMMFKYNSNLGTFSDRKVSIRPTSVRPKSRLPGLLVCQQAIATWTW